MKTNETLQAMQNVLMTMDVETMTEGERATLEIMAEMLYKMARQSTQDGVQAECLEMMPCLPEEYQF